MAGKQAAAAAKAREHLIGNHQGTSCVGSLLDSLQERLTHHRHATSALQQGLKDHCGSGGLQQFIEPLQGLGFFLFNRLNFCQCGYFGQKQA